MNTKLTPTLISNIYIHIPLCIRKCSFCDYPVIPITHSIHQYMEQYLSYLKREIIVYNKHLQYLNVQSIYFGGGTPSLMTSKQIQSILSLFTFNSQTQITLQMHPSNISEQYYAEIQKQNINKISIGLQTFNNDIIKKLNRLQGEFIYPKNIPWGVDLMVGIGQTQHQLISDIIKLCNLSPNSINLYPLQIHPNTPISKKHQYLYDQQKIQKLLNASQLLEQLGYKEVEIFCYILKDKGKYPIHNSMYWMGDREFMAFGMGASSYIANSRYQRPRTLKKYYRFVQEVQKDPSIILKGDIQSEEILKQNIMLGSLRTQKGLQINKIQGILDSVKTLQNKLQIQIFNIKQGHLFIKKRQHRLQCDYLVSELIYNLK